MDKQQFISQIVQNWIKRDIERLKAAIPAKDNEVGNINFPLALCILSYIDCLGGYLIGQNITGEAEHRITTYINTCFPEEAKNEYSPKILVVIFRDGLAHQYFPKGPISRSKTRPAMFISQDNEIILSVESLSDDFLKSLDIFSKELSDDMYLESRKKFENKIKKDLEKCSEDLLKLSKERIINSNSNISTSGTASYLSLVSTYPIR